MQGSEGTSQCKGRVRRSAGVGGYAVVQEGVNRIAVQEGGRPQYRVYAAL